MGLASVPILVAIFGVVQSIVRVIWDTCAKAASRAAFYFTLILPYVLRWFIKSRVFMLAVVVALGLAFVAAFRTAFATFNNTISMSNQFQTMFNQFKWMSYILWDGPLNLREMYRRIPDIIGTWASLCTLRFLFVRMRWYLKLAQMKVAVK